MRSAGWTRLTNLFGLVVLGALVAACSDEPMSGPTGAGPVAAVAASANVTLGLPAPSQNTAKYRDSGKPHATGRSGNATLNVRALYGHDGQTTLQVTTGAIDAVAAAPGNIEKLQVKLLETGKLQRPVWTMNYNDLAAGGSWAQAIPGIAQGRTLQVTAHITGIDDRTDVVIVREKVKKLPDLSVVEVDAPAKAEPDAPVDILAVVRELNADVGARADCVLSVDGAPVDRANGIWVDAAGTVSCAFNHAFSTPGAHALRVSVEGVRPGDWDPENDAATASITVQSAVSQLLDSAFVIDASRTYSWRSEIKEVTNNNGITTTDQRVMSTDTTARWQDARMVGWTPWAPDVKVAFPLQRLDISHSSGTLSTTGTFANVAAQRDSSWVSAGNYEAGAQCAEGYADGGLGRVLMSVCVIRRRLFSTGASAGDPLADDQWYSSTQVKTSRLAGSVTYMARNYRRYHIENDPDGEVGCTSQGPDGSDYCYFSNRAATSKDGTGWVDGQVPPLGSAYSMGLTIVGVSGATHTTRADVALDQPYRPFWQMVDGQVVATDRYATHDCVTRTSTPEQLAYGITYSYSNCTDVSRVATGKYGSLSREVSGSAGK